MKRRWALITTLILAVVLIACVATACDPTEEPTEVTLKIYRGGIGDDIVLTELPGTDISSELPTPNSTQTYYFGGWYDNDNFTGEAVELPTEMPKESASFYARWYVKYTVAVMLEQADGEFSKSEELSFEGEADKGATSATFEVDVPQGYVDGGSPREGQLVGRDTTFEVKFELTKATLTFDFNGEGENLSKDLPAAVDNENYFFGGWYADSELTEQVQTLNVMPESDATYYARWYRTYKIDAYVQNADHTDYEFSDSQSFEINKGTATVTASASLFEALSTYLQPADITVEISSKSESVGALYFDRDDVKITYDFGDVAEGFYTYAQRGTKYQPSVPEGVLDNAYFNGLRLNGFTLSGEAVDDFTPTQDATLVATFDEAYIERNGSVDLLWIPKSEEGKAYLYRAGLGEIAGTYEPTSKMFSFLEGELVGRVYDDGTFATQREKFDFKMYDFELNAPIDSAILSLDGIDGATLTLTEDSDELALIYVDEAMIQKAPSFAGYLHQYVPFSLPKGAYKGSYRVDENYSDIALTLTYRVDDKNSIDAEIHLRLGEYENKDLSLSDVFGLRGEEFGIYSDDFADILLDGYGYAYYILSDGKYTSGRYGAFTLDESERLPDLPACTEYAAVFPTGTVYFEKPESMTPNADGIPSAQIYRYDGLYGAYYDFSDEESLDPETYAFSGYGYAYKDGERYSYKLENGDTMSTYLLRFISLYDAEGNFVMKALIDEAYGGYYKMSKDAMAYALTDFASATELIAIDGEDAIYFYSDGQGSLYYTDGKIEDLGENDAGVTIFKYTDNYPINDDDFFTFFMLETDGVIACYIEDTPVYNGTFEGERGESITLDGFGNALYLAADGSIHEGRYLNYSEDGDGVMRFLCDNDYCAVDFFFSIEGDKFKPYVEEETETFTLQLIGYETGGIALYTNIELSIDDKNAAELTIKIDDEVLTIKGSVELYDAMNFYYLFKVSSVEGDQKLADDWGISSDFIFMRTIVSVASETSEVGYEYVDAFMFSDGFEGEFDIDGDSLVIDGFGYGAFRGESGEYELMTDGRDGNAPHYVIAFYDVQGYTYFFDIAPDGTHTLRGNEFIMDYYYLMTDEGLVNILLMPDGRGNLEIAIYLTEEPYTGVYSMAEGKYSVDDEGNLHAYDVEYTTWTVMEGFTKDECDLLNSYALSLQYLYGLLEEFDFTLFAMDLGSSYGLDYFFQVRDVDLYHAYVLDDLSVLILDGFYTAIYIDRYGDMIYGEYSVTKYLGTDENEEEYIISIVRIESEGLAFWVEARGAAHIGWEYGNYANGDDVITLNGMPGDKSCVTYTSGDIYKEGTYTVDTNLMICTATFEDGSKLVFRVDIYTGNFIIRDDSIVGDYDCVDREGNKLGSTLSMDGLGRATITNSDGSWERYDVANVNGDIYELTNYYNANDTLTVKLYTSADGNTYRVSDGQKIEENLHKFDFLKGAILDESKPLSIDSFDIVYIGDEAIGQVTSVENPEGEWMAIYHVTLNDGTETGFCRFRAYKFDMGNVNFYTQYDEQTAATFTDSEGSAFPLYLTGYGIGMREGNSPENENHDSYNAIYWFEDEKLHVDDLWVGNSGGEKIYTLNFEDHTFVLSKESAKADFVVEGGVLVAYLGRNPNVVIPTDMGIKEIGDNVFSVKNSSYNEGSLDFNLESIDLSGVVEIIGESAFRGILSNLNLSSITGTQNVKVIKDNAFYCTGISEIDLPNIVEIGYQGFYGSKSLGTITLGNESTVWNEAGIGEKAFMGSINVAEGVVNFNAPHVPKLGAKAFNAGAKKRTINFKFKSAYDEAMDSSTEIGATWKEFVDATNVTFVDLESQAAAGASLEGQSTELYFEDKRAA